MADGWNFGLYNIMGGLVPKPVLVYVVEGVWGGYYWVVSLWRHARLAYICVVQTCVAHTFILPHGDGIGAPSSAEQMSSGWCVFDV